MHLLLKTWSQSDSETEGVGREGREGREEV